MTPRIRPAEYDSAIEALITWYDDLTHGRAPSVARRRTIINNLRRTPPHPDAAVACAIGHLARPDAAHLRTDSLLAIERLRRHANAAGSEVEETP